MLAINLAAVRPDPVIQVISFKSLAWGRCTVFLHMYAYVLEDRQPHLIVLAATEGGLGSLGGLGSPSGLFISTTKISKRTKCYMSSVVESEGKFRAGPAFLSFARGYLQCYWPKLNMHLTGGGGEGAREKEKVLQDPGQSIVLDDLAWHGPVTAHLRFLPSSFFFFLKKKKLSLS